jgi:hypothetical protein
VPRFPLRSPGPAGSLPVPRRSAFHPRFRHERFGQRSGIFDLSGNHSHPQRSQCHISLVTLLMGTLYPRMVHCANYSDLDFTN